MILKKLQISALQKKCSNLEMQLLEQTQRGNQLVEENKQLLSSNRKVDRTAYLRNSLAHVKSD